MITARTFELLGGLRENNDRSWFNEHKAEFRERVQQPFAELLEAASRRLRRSANPLQGSSKTMFRIYRDTRFSNDKRPYKEHVAGLLTPTGTKDESEGLMYVQMGVDGGLIATGIYAAPTPRLNEIRDAMVDDPKPFQRAVAKLTRGGFEMDMGDPVKTMPRGYAEHADHPLADLMRRRNLVASGSVPVEAWIDGSVIDRIVELNRAAMPLNDLIFGQR